MRGILLGAFALSTMLLRSSGQAKVSPSLTSDHKSLSPSSPTGNMALLASLLIPLAWWSGARHASSAKMFPCSDDKALFDALIETCPDVIFLKGIDGVYLACNRAAAALFGRAQHEVVGKSDADLFPKEVACQHRLLDQKVIATRRSVVEEQLVPEGEKSETRTLDMLKTAVERPDGTVMGVLGVARDVTVRRRQEQKMHEQEQLLHEMSALANIGGWEIDVAEDSFSFTTELARLHEFDPDRELSLAMFLSHYGDAERLRIENALAQTLKTGAPQDLDVEMILPSGAHKWIRALWRATSVGDEVTRIWGMVQDTTARRKLSESMQMADLIYRTTSDAILVADRRNIVVDANPAFLRLFKYARGDVIGMTASQLLAESSASKVPDTLRRVLDEQGSWEGEMRCRRRDGTIIDVSVDINILREGDKNEFRRAIHIADLTEHKRKDQQLWVRSNFDQLTGLPNRSLFLDRLEQELKKSRTSNACVGLLCLDLDHFSEINEMVGHSGGDLILVETSARISACLSGTATVGRLAGDRFGVIVSDGLRAQLEITAQAIMNILSVPLLNDAPHEWNVDGKVGMDLSASIGIAVFPDDFEHAEALIKAAEQAMVQAKRSGGKRFQYFAPAQQQAALEKMRMLNELRHALAREQLQVFFQPIVHVASGRIEKAEALLRWTHPVLGSISPAQFIPLAEQSGLIVEIGSWVIDQAIASVEHWQENFGTRIELSVNSSPVQFEQNAANAWIDRLANSGLPPMSITIEITEGMLISDSEHVRQCLNRLKRNGSKVSLDDFGTGYSALSYLKNFAFDYLKSINRSSKIWSATLATRR